MDTTALTVAEIRVEISKLEEIKVRVCDTPAFDLIQEAIEKLKNVIKQKDVPPACTTHYADAKFIDVPTGMEKLKAAVALRDKMSGGLYWSAVNEDCCNIARAITRMGGDRTACAELLGEGSFK